MRPKLNGMLAALDGGVKEVQIVSAGGLMKELLTKSGSGTMLVKNLSRPGIKRTLDLTHCEKECCVQ